jgi:hypothetical protein
LSCSIAFLSFCPVRQHRAIAPVQCLYDDEAHDVDDQYCAADERTRGKFGACTDAVGPFASAGKAAKLCSGLKAAGGDCIILKN